MISKGVRLYVGNLHGTIQGQLDNLNGDRMFTAAYPPSRANYNLSELNGYIDSGAFSDPPNKRLSFGESLHRQLSFENIASNKWGGEWQSSGLVSYDYLIDEVWTDGKKYKRRWDIKKADFAVQQTIDAAKFLTENRNDIEPRRLILSCQGVDAIQYADCVKEVLKFARPQDVIGLGGWCILGRYTSWINQFYSTITTIIPLISQKSIKDVHIFGVLYEPALAPLLYLGDKYGINISTDSTAPVKSALPKTLRGLKKSGCRATSGIWQDNVQWWVNHLNKLYTSRYYNEPNYTELFRQLMMFE